MYVLHTETQLVMGHHDTATDELTQHISSAGSFVRNSKTCRDGSVHRMSHLA